MQLLVTLSTKRGVLTSPFFSPTDRACLIVTMPESVQDLRDSDDACGLTYPVLKWLDSVRLVGSGFLPQTWDDLLYEFAGRILNANTCGVIRDVEDECLEFTMVFTNMGFRAGGRTFPFSELQDLTKDYTLSPSWSD